MPQRAAVSMNAAHRLAGTRLAACLELFKARLVALVVLTAGVGFVLAGPPRMDWLRLVWTLLGTALAAAGANALNQWLEVDRDARMRRTCMRPLPTRRLQRGAALALGLAAALGGPLMLAMSVGRTVALLALAALLLHVLVYTPLKVHTPLNTLVGAAVGAIPPVLGWAAATGRTEPGAWVLGGILFFWQIPHSLALAWLHREDYARGGFRMLPAADQGGALTGLVAVLYTLVLLPLSFVLTPIGVTGWSYAVGSLLLGLGLLLAAVGLERHRSSPAARRLFLASVIYLPILLGLMALDRRLGPG